MNSREPSRTGEVLHAQAGALEQAKPCAIEEDRHEPRDAVDLGEHGADFLGRQDDRQVVRALGIDEVVEPGNVLLEDLAVEEEEGAEGLVLRRRRHLAIDGQRRQEARELSRSHLGGMALAVEEDVAADPGDVRLLGATAIVPGANGMTHAIEQPRLWRIGRAGLAHRERRGLRVG